MTRHAGNIRSNVHGFQSGHNSNGFLYSHRLTLENLVQIMYSIPLQATGHDSKSCDHRV